jgi:tight adherence protein B
VSTDLAGPARAALMADRVAALSLAGLPLPRIWQVLSEQADELSDLAAAVDAAAVGRSSAIGLRLAAPGDPALAWVAVACRAAELGGAPVAGVLAAVSTTLRAEAEGARARQAALAGPRATTTVLSWLPLAGFGLGLAIGVDAVTVLVTTPPGWVCLACGSVLWWAGRRWMTVLLRRAEQAGAERVATARPATELDLPAEVFAEIVASLVDAGLPPPGAVQVTRRCLDELELGSPPVPAELASALQLSQRTGVAPSSLLRSAAAERRRRRQAAATTAANRLAVLAVLPIGLCLLPAFVLLTVAPLVLALFAHQLS